MQSDDIASKKPKTRRKRRLKRIIVWVIVLTVLAGAGVLGVGMLRQEYTVTYDAYTATTGSIANALSFSGSLGLISSATYTAASDSTVRAVYFQAGDEVAKGDKLLRLANGQTVEAEFDGRVNVLNAAAGDEVSAGDTLAQVADFSRMKVSIRVDEYDISSVSVGQACTVTATATERAFASSIDSIDYISASTGTVAYYTAVCYVDVPADAGVYPGMQATITVPKEEARDVVVLKMDALSFDEANSAYVYRQDASGALNPQYVTVGISNGNYVEIKSGLASGDTVYVEAASTAQAAGLGGLLSGVFGSTRMNGGTGATRGTGTYTRGTGSGGTQGGFAMPSGGTQGGFTMPSGGTQGGTGK